MTKVALLISVTTFGAAGLSVDANMQGVVAALAAVVVAVLAVTKWIDSRIEHKINAFGQKNRLVNQLILQELRHIKTLVTGTEVPVLQLPDDEKGAG